MAATLIPDAAERAARAPEYLERLEIELGTIIQMGFPGYFLIVADFINWAKHNGVPVGPGRGSGAGSLVAYSHRHHRPRSVALCPAVRAFPEPGTGFHARLRHRFLPGQPLQGHRVCARQIWRRRRVPDRHLRHHGGRAVVRDVGRVLDLPYNFCDQLSKMIPSAPGKSVTLDQALAEVPELKERYEREEEVRELIDLARKLEGLTRNVGMHAGGVLIAPGKLTDFCPLYCSEGSESVVSQLDKDDVEKIGLVKFDFLGLRNLTIIDSRPEVHQAASIRAADIRPGYH